MKVLVTGAGGFIGKNLIATLKVGGHDVLEYHHATGLETLEKFCGECEFVFHLAGVNLQKALMNSRRATNILPPSW